MESRCELSVAAELTIGCETEEDTRTGPLFASEAISISSPLKAGLFLSGVLSTFIA
jgi:hypothetical protein